MIRQTISRIINAEFRIASLQVDKDGCFKTCQETNGHMAFLHEGKRNKCIIMHRYLHFIRLLVKIRDACSWKEREVGKFMFKLERTERRWKEPSEIGKNRPKLESFF